MTNETDFKPEKIIIPRKEFFSCNGCPNLKHVDDGESCAPRHKYYCSHPKIFTMTDKEYQDNSISGAGGFKPGPDSIKGARLMRTDPIETPKWCPLLENKSE